MLFTDICCLQLNQSFSRPCKAPDNSSSRLESPSSVDFLNVSNDSFESETSKKVVLNPHLLASCTMSC